MTDVSYPQWGTPGEAAPKNYLVFAILSILCCWPFAIPAIIFASQVNTKYAQGDYAGAQNSSQKAKMWSIIAIVLGLVVTVIAVILNIVIAASDYGSPTYVS